MMKRILFLLVLLVPGAALATDPWLGPDGHKVTAVNEPKEITWNPATSATSATIYTRMPMTCAWNADNSQSGTGTVTLTIYRCTANSGTQANDCNQNASGTNGITAGDSGAHFNMDPGYWMAVASGTATHGLLTCDPQVLPPG